MSPFMTTRELAVYLRFVNDAGEPDASRAYKWLIRYRVDYRKRGAKSILVRREDVDAKLEDA